MLVLHRGWYNNARLKVRLKYCFDYNIGATEFYLTKDLSFYTAKAYIPLPDRIARLVTSLFCTPLSNAAWPPSCPQPISGQWRKSRTLISNPAALTCCQHVYYEHMYHALFTPSATPLIPNLRYARQGLLRLSILQVLRPTAIKIHFIMFKWMNNCISWYNLTPAWCF